MKRGRLEGPFTALPEKEAAEVCAQLRDIWRPRNLTFDDYRKEQCGSSEDVGIKDVSGRLSKALRVWKKPSLRISRRKLL